MDAGLLWASGLDLAGFRSPEFPALDSDLLSFSGLDSGLLLGLLLGWILASWGLLGWILASTGFLLTGASWARLWLSAFLGSGFGFWLPGGS